MAKIPIGLGKMKGLTYYDDEDPDYPHPFFIDGAPEHGILRGVGNGWFTVDTTIWDLLAGLVGSYEYVLEDDDEKQVYTSVFGGGTLFIKVKTVE